MKTQTILIVLIVLIVIGAITFAIQKKLTPETTSSLPTETQFQFVSYTCNAGKTIDAQYVQGETKPGTPGQPPVPGGSVKLHLSDGRDLILPQTISADGVRYANTDESFVFWSKGNGALVLENNQEKSFIGCIQVAKDPGGLSQIFESSSEGFSIRYPQGYSADAKYVYQALGPGKDIYGVKVTIPSSVATGTNLGSDSYISIEQIPRATSCTADRFLDMGNLRITPQTITENNTTYSVASTTGAGAGNRYEETVYALPGTNPCIAVRYFIHYGVIENYPAGVVKEFDKQALLKQFDAIRNTLIVNQ